MQTISAATALTYRLLEWTSWPIKIAVLRLAERIGLGPPAGSP